MTHMLMDVLQKLSETLEPNGYGEIDDGSFLVGG